MKTRKSTSPTIELADENSPNVTKRQLVLDITKELADEVEARAAKTRQTEHVLSQAEVLAVIQKTLDHMSKALAQNKKIELRNFGVFEVRVRKAGIGRNPRKPDVAVPWPNRAVVRFKAGKELSEMVLRLTSTLEKKK